MHSDIIEIIRRANALPYGPERCQLLEEALREADLAQDTQSALFVAYDLTTAYTMNRQPDRAVNRFARCLAFSDKNPENILNRDAILCRYAELLVGSTDCLRISVAQFDEMIEDLRERFRVAGASQRLFHHCVWRHLSTRGSFERAAEHFEQWKLAPQDSQSYPVAIDLHSECSYHRRRGELELARCKGLEAWSMPVPAGHSYLPRYISKDMHQIACMLGEASDADIWLERFQVHEHESDPICASDPYVCQDLLVGEYEKTQELLVKLARGFLDTSQPEDHFYSTTVFGEAMRRLSQAGVEFVDFGKHPLRELAHDQGRHRTSDLSEFLLALSHDVQLEFDARNGNDFHAVRRHRLMSIGAA